MTESVEGSSGPESEQLLNPQRVHERLLGLVEKGDFGEIARRIEDCLGLKYRGWIRNTAQSAAPENGGSVSVSRDKMAAYIPRTSLKAGLYVICRHDEDLPSKYEALGVEDLAECTWKVGAGQQITARRGASAELEIEAKSYNAINYQPIEHAMRGDLWFRPDGARAAMEARGERVYVLFHVRTHYRHRSPAKPRTRVIRNTTAQISSPVETSPSRSPNRSPVDFEHHDHLLEGGSHERHEEDYAQKRPREEGDEEAEVGDDKPTTQQSVEERRRAAALALIHIHSEE